ncbi:patatin-like phospholipase family protein [Kribbella pratensis]|uniref:NTE family protein n=1 Tax=Kribbella pratensis TaxID=2512112 RepID=A0A4R8C3R8_9ACTN|nr:patatin-like phospholipase family protein [Kribbella pratensis]TDW69755.1 NTE family protein [Kribbella pratensis]
MTDLALQGSRGLVLGAGGSVGRAWQTGFVAGAIESGLDLGSADLIVGTSAGAIVGAEIALGRDMRTTLPPPSQGDETPPRPDPAILAMITGAAVAPDPAETRRRIGAAALEAVTPDEATAMARPNIVSMKGVPWPRRFRAAAVSITTGQLILLDKSSGASLQQALAASSAMPSVWPPITIGHDRYIDGGVRSSLNADAAADADRVLVISCHSVGAATPRGAALAEEIETLRRHGPTVEVVMPAQRFLDLTDGGRDLLNPSLEIPAFEAGRRQWIDETDRVKRFWDRSTGQPEKRMRG